MARKARGKAKSVARVRTSFTTRSRAALQAERDIPSVETISEALPSGEHIDPVADSFEKGVEKMEQQEPDVHDNVSESSVELGVSDDFIPKDSTSLPHKERPESFSEILLAVNVVSSEVSLPTSAVEPVQEMSESVPIEEHRVADPNDIVKSCDTSIEVDANDEENLETNDSTLDSAVSADSLPNALESVEKDTMETSDIQVGNGLPVASSPEETSCSANSLLPDTGCEAQVERAETSQLGHAGPTLEEHISPCELIDCRPAETQAEHEQSPREMDIDAPAQENPSSPCDIVDSHSDAPAQDSPTPIEMHVDARTLEDHSSLSDVADNRENAPLAQSISSELAVREADRLEDHNIASVAVEPRQEVGPEHSLSPDPLTQDVDGQEDYNSVDMDMSDSPSVSPPLPLSEPNCKVEERSESGQDQNTTAAERFQLELLRLQLDLNRKKKDNDISIKTEHSTLPKLEDSPQKETKPSLPPVPAFIMKQIKGDCSSIDQPTISPIKIPMPEPKVSPKNTNQSTIKEKVDAVPDFPKYEEIEALIYMDDKVTKTGKKVKRALETSLFCECKRNGWDCSDDRCINREMMYECPSSCGSKCQNRRFSQRQYADVQTFYTGPKKGWGIRANSLIKKGTFIIEYLGEVVTHEEFANRSRKYSADPTHTHHYVFELGQKVIDATKKGSCSRFINHSCEPNAKCLKWAVPKTPRDVSRIGFFALRDIEIGEEITFDYQFCNYGRTAQSCHCGAPSCKGVIGDSRSDVDDDVDEDEEDGEEMQEEDEEEEAVSHSMSEAIQLEREMERERQALKQLHCLMEDCWSGRKDIVKLAVRFVKNLWFVTRTDDRLRMLSFIERSDSHFYQAVKRKGLYHVFNGWLISSDWSRHNMELKLGVLKLMNTKDNFLEKGSGWTKESYKVISQLAGHRLPDEVVVQDTMEHLLDCMEKGRDIVHGDPSDNFNHSSHERLFMRITEAASRLYTDTDIQRGVAANHLTDVFKIPKKMKELRVSAGKDVPSKSSVSNLSVERSRWDSKEQRRRFEMSPDRSLPHARRWKNHKGSNGRSMKRKFGYDANRTSMDYVENGGPVMKMGKVKAEFDMAGASPEVSRRRSRFDSPGDSLSALLDQPPPPPPVGFIDPSHLADHSSSLLRISSESTPRQKAGTNQPKPAYLKTPRSSSHPEESPLGQDLGMWSPAANALAFGMNKFPVVPLDGSFPQNVPYGVPLSGFVGPSLPSMLQLDEKQKKEYYDSFTREQLASCRDSYQSEVDILNEVIHAKDVADALEKQKIAQKAAADAAAAALALVQTAATMRQQSHIMTPPPPPERRRSNFAKALDADGTVYYFHKDTRATTWDLPEGETCDEDAPIPFAAQPDSSMDLDEAKTLYPDVASRAYEIFSSSHPSASTNKTTPPVRKDPPKTTVSTTSTNETLKQQKIKQFKLSVEREVEPIISEFLKDVPTADQAKQTWLTKQIAKEMYKRESSRPDFNMELSDNGKKKVQNYTKSFMQRKCANGGKDLWKGYEKA